jgi:hypothetical protein
MIFLLYLSIPIGIDPVETNEALKLAQHSALFLTPSIFVTIIRFF